MYAFQAAHMNRRSLQHVGGFEDITPVYVLVARLLPVQQLSPCDSLGIGADAAYAQTVPESGKGKYAPQS